ncbi:MULTISPECIES: hypothetical protein [unclassified Aliiroseovarius]|nr:MULTISPECIES: hypothetical protein [unclassified Aliiroseovarius]
MGLEGVVPFASSGFGATRSPAAFSPTGFSTSSLFEDGSSLDVVDLAWGFVGVFDGLAGVFAPSAALALLLVWALEGPDEVVFSGVADDLTVSAAFSSITTASSTDFFTVLPALASVALDAPFAGLRELANV